MFADNKTDTTLHFVDSVYFGNSRSINSVRSEQLRKVDPGKFLLMQVSKKFFDQSEAPISHQTNKY